MRAMGALADQMTLARWLSPAFPVSGYAYSHGLETALAEGRVRDAAGLRAWIDTVLRRGAGALDAWAIREAMAGRGDAASATLRARAGCAERWEETRAQGAAFGATTAALGAPPLPPGLPLPVALGRRAAGMDPATVCALYLQAFAAQLVSVAVRAMPLGQVAAQAVLADLAPVAEAVAAVEHDAAPGSAAVGAEMDAMRHETLQPRMFRT